MPKRDPLADNPFRFIATKAGSVMIYSNGRLARTLKGSEAAGFLSKAGSSENEELRCLWRELPASSNLGTSVEEWAALTDGVEREDRT